VSAACGVPVDVAVACGADGDAVGVGERAERGGVAAEFLGEVPAMNVGVGLPTTTPGADGAEYLAVCLPAFSPDTVHRDD
jgi:hypothetical protein